MKLAKERLLRIMADIVLVNISLLIAIILRLLSTLLIEFNHSVTFGDHSLIAYGNGVRGLLLSYKSSAVLLTLVCLVIFSLSGFYTYGRTYRSRYKALVILQAVTLSYFIFGFINYMFYVNDRFPRSIFLLGWVVTLGLVGGARLWSSLWKTTVTVEGKLGLNAKTKDPKNVLVIGGAGYLGSVLVRKLLWSGYNVKVLDILMYGDLSIRDLYSYERRFKVIKGDFRSVDTIMKSMEDIDTVVHLGAIVGDPACQIDQKLTFDINLMATKMIAEVAKGFGVRRLIFASTCSVYGASDELLTEKSSLNPQSLYAKTKIGSERILLSLCSSDFSPVILRFATLYGMSYRPRFDLVINLLTAKALREKKIAIFGGDQWRPFLHVEDAAEAIFKCIRIPLHNKEVIFNAGSNEQNYRICQVGRMIKEVISEVEIINREENQDKRNYRVGFDKIRNTLDFVPKKTVEDGIMEITEALRYGWVGDYKSANYNNYEFINDEINSGLFKLNTMPRDIYELESMAGSHG